MKSIALYYSTKYQQEETPVDTNKETVQNEELVKDGEANDSDKKDESKNDLKTEFHVNIWKVEEGTFKLSPRFYFDFGVMFPKEYKALCLYLPFEIEGTPEDLSGYLTGNQSTLSAVFNADTRTWAHNNPNYFLTSAMHHPKTLIEVEQELLHQTILNSRPKFFLSQEYTKCHYFT